MMSEVDRMRLLALFSQYEEKDTAVAECKRAAVTAEKTRSDVVRSILEANGGKKKIRRNGQELTIVIRGETHFFRGSKQSDDVTEV